MTYEAMTRGWGYLTGKGALGLDEAFASTQSAKSRSHGMIFPFFKPKKEAAYARRMCKLLKEIHGAMDGSLKTGSAWQVYDLYGEIDELFKEMDDKRAGDQV